MTSYIISLLFVRHEESNKYGNGVDLVQEPALVVPDFCKFKEEAKIFCKVPAV